MLLDKKIFLLLCWLLSLPHCDFSLTNQLNTFTWIINYGKWTLAVLLLLTKKETEMHQRCCTNIKTSQFLNDLNKIQIVHEKYLHVRSHVWSLSFIVTHDIKKMQFSNYSVRHKVKELIDFVQDNDRLRQERKRAKQNREKYVGLSSDVVSDGFYSKFSILINLLCTFSC